MVLVYKHLHHWVILWQMLGFIFQHRGSHMKRFCGARLLAQPKGRRWRPLTAGSTARHDAFGAPFFLRQSAAAGDSNVTNIMSDTGIQHTQIQRSFYFWKFLLIFFGTHLQLHSDTALQCGHFRSTVISWSFCLCLSDHQCLQYAEKTLVLPSGKHTKNYGKSPFLVDK